MLRYGFVDLVAELEVRERRRQQVQHGSPYSGGRRVAAGDDLEEDLGLALPPGEAVSDK